MKYDINGLERNKIIDHYKIKLKRNGLFNIYIYFRGDIKPHQAVNWSYKDMVDMQQLLDSKMHEQMDYLVNNEEVALKTFSEAGAKKSLFFKCLGLSLSVISPIILSILFGNFLNLLLIPIFLKITAKKDSKYQENVIEEGYNDYKKYKLFLESEEEFEEIKNNKLDINKVDNYQIEELKKLREELIELKNQKVYIKK